MADLSVTLSVPSILNFRDVSDTVNRAAGLNLLQKKKLFRSARPDNASSEDRQRLRDDYGVKTIIDLRTETEHIENARKRDKSIKASAAVPQSNSQAAEPLKIPGITYHDINFNGKAYSQSLLKQLTWLQYIKLIALMISGYRIRGIRVLGENVMRQRGLIGLAEDSIDVCTKEVKQVFDVLADEDCYPVMIHCTQGKDRTGLTVMLALLVCGVSLEAIDADYMLSQSELQAETAERIQEIVSIGLTEDFAGCDPKLVTSVHDHIVSKYGSVERYLSEACGVTRDMQGRVRKIMMQELTPSRQNLE